MSENENAAVLLAQAQLDAYNSQNIEAFMQCYADTVEVFDFETGELLFSGAAAMHTRYAKLFENKDIHAELVKRMVHGNFVIDEESVSGMGPDRVHAIAMYQIFDGSIQKVWFIK